MSTCNSDKHSSDNSEYESAGDDESAENNFRSDAGYARCKKTQCCSGLQHVSGKDTHSKDGGCNIENTTDQSFEAEITEINAASCIQIDTSELDSGNLANETQEDNADLEYYSGDPPENDDPDVETTEEPSESPPEVQEDENTDGVTTEDTENVNDNKNPSESEPNDDLESSLSGSELEESVYERCPEEFDIKKAGELLLKLEDDDIGLTKGKMVKFATLIVVIRAVSYWFKNKYHAL